MSTIRVSKVEATDSASNNIELTSSGIVVSGVTTATNIDVTNIDVTSINSLNYPTAGPLSNRNLIINGAMQFAQRNISVNNITSTDAYLTVDRYRQFINTLGTWTVERHASGPPGFDYSYRATCTSGNASPAAGSYAFIRYGVEKQDMQRLAWVTTGAKEFTLSFWVKSNRTGTASLTILYSDGNLRGMTKTYTIDALNTWEHKSLTFPANGLSESSEGDNGVGFWIEWWLNSGSTFTGGSANTNWATLNDNQRNPTNFGLGSVNDQEFHLTGVQLEVGSKATPFEHRSYGDELQRCQRYFHRYTTSRFVSGYKRADTECYFEYQSPVPMRTTPTPTLNNSGLFSDFNTVLNNNITSPLVFEYDANGGFGVFNVSSTWSATHSLIPAWEGFDISFSAEL